MGYQNRYLTKNRSPWYKIEVRKSSPILFGAFSRGRLKVVRNYTNVISFTCYHSFYPNMFGDQIINKLFVYLFSDTGQKILKTNKRSYGGDLDKFEPGDLNCCLCPNQNQFELLKDKEVQNVLETALHDEKLAIQMSNNLIDRILNKAC